MKVLVDEAERRWIAKEASKTMGSKVTHKVIDLDKVVARIRKERIQRNLSPYIEIQPISEDQHKVPHHSGTFQKDPITGVLYGIALNADEFGNIRWQKIQLNDMLSLNLDNENDARIWAVIRFNPDILGSPFQKDAPYYKLYDPVDEALAEQAEILMMEKAFDRVRLLIKDPKQMVQFARFMGEEVRDNANYDVIHGVLLKRARYEPVLFNKRWENRARSFAEHFYSGVALGIITEDANIGFMYQNIPLGITRAESIKKLAKDSNLMSSLSSVLEEKDKAVKEVTASMERRTVDSGAERKIKEGNESSDFE